MLSFYRAASLFLLFLCPCVTAQMVAQTLVDPVATVNLEREGQDIKLHALTGIPILVTTTGYAGMDPKTGDIIWSADRSGLAKADGIVSATGGESEVEDYFEFPNTPLVFAGNKIVNVGTGKVIVDGSESQLRAIDQYYTLPSQDMILVQAAAKGAKYLYGVDPFTEEMKFGVKLRDVKGLGLAGTDAGVKPKINAEGNLLYAEGKNLALIDMKTGELLWNEEYKPGYIFTNADGTRMVIAERRGGGGGLGAAMNPLAGLGGGSDVQKFGHALRDFRNYIHPNEQLRSGFSPDRHTAKLCFHAFIAALSDIAGTRN